MFQRVVAFFAKPYVLAPSIAFIAPSPTIVYTQPIAEQEDDFYLKLIVAQKTRTIPTHIAKAPESDTQIVAAWTQHSCPEGSRYTNPQCLGLYSVRGVQVDELVHIDPKGNSAPNPEADKIISFCVKPPFLAVKYYFFASKGVALGQMMFRYQVEPYPTLNFDSYSLINIGQEIPQKEGCEAEKPRKVLILAEGLGSSLISGSETQNQAFAEIKRGVELLYDDVITYSYLGGRMAKDNGGQAVWLPNSYLSQNTFQSPDKSALNVALMLRQYKKSYPNAIFDGVGHSLGGFTLWEAAKTHLLPQKGLLRNSNLRSLATIASPVNGSEQARLTSWIQSAGFWDFQTQIGNDAVLVLAAMADGERRQQTITINASVARFLTEQRGFKVFTFGSPDDCMVSDEDALIPGFGLPIAAGRGDQGVSSCEPTAAWELLSGGDVTERTGHSQLLSYRQVIKKLVEQASS